MPSPEAAAWPSLGLGGAGDWDEGARVAPALMRGRVAGARSASTRSVPEGERGVAAEADEADEADEGAA